jgi:hypothetical protein
LLAGLYANETDKNLKLELMRTLAKSELGQATGGHRQE